MDLSLISKYRSQLMGIAILWVMFFHLPLINVYSKIQFILSFKNMGYGGVDMFMLLSGIGIFYSLNRDSSIKNFYKRRFIRIIPYYTPIVLLYSLFFYYQGNLSLGTVFLNVTTISFWISSKGLFDWYMPTILAFYLVSPFLVSLIKKNNKILFILIFTFSFLIFFLLAGTKYYYLLPVFGRFPTFLFGLYLGSQFVSKKNIHCSRFQIILLIFSLIAGVFLWKFFLVSMSSYWTSYGILMVPLWLITFPLCVFLSYLLSLIKNYKYPILTFFGTNSLIFYIFHERIMNVMTFYGIQNITIVAFVLTIILGLAWKKIVDKIIESFSAKKIVVVK